MKSDNLFNAPNPKDKETSWNTNTSFADSAHSVTTEERDAALAARQAMIQETIKALKDCC